MFMLEKADAMRVLLACNYLPLSSKTDMSATKIDRFRSVYAKSCVHHLTFLSIMRNARPIRVTQAIYVSRLFIALVNSW